jgi:hypothetical protein
MQRIKGTGKVRLGMLSGVLAVAAVLSGHAARAEAPGALDKVDVIWNTPSANSAGSMPIGNGQVVLNVWVEKGTGDVLMLIARTDSLSEICRFLKLGRVRIHLDGAPLEGTDFKQELRLRQGAIDLSGGGVQLRVFVDSGSDVVHIAGSSAAPVAATATVECWRNEDRQLPPGEKGSSWTTHDAPFPLIESKDVFAPGSDAVVWYHRNEHSVVPQLLETQSLTGAKGAFDPLLHRTFGGRMAGAGFVGAGDRGLKTAQPTKTIDLSIATYAAQTDTVAQWTAGVQAEASTSADARMALARTEHWWGDFWDRSWVFVDEPHSIPANKHALRVGVDSGGGSRFAGQIVPQEVLGEAASAEKVAQMFAAGRPDNPLKDVPAMPDVSKGMTLAAWIHPTGSTDGRIFDKVTAGVDDGFLFDTHPGNSLRLIVGNTLLNAPNCLKPGQWQHVAATFDAANGAAAIYLDGKQIAHSGADNGVSPVTRGYNLQRYLQACQGRGTYPIKFNGGFYTVEYGGYNADWRQWGDCYWWQNTRHMYHPMLMAGDFDLMNPLFKLYEDATPLAESRTAKYHNASGAYFPETMTLFGTYGGDYVWNRKGKQPKDVDCPWWQYAWNQGPELVALMLDRYDWTGDETFLKNEALPMADAVLRYFDMRFRKDAAGKIVLDPAQAVETYWHGVINDAPTVAGIANITRRLAALPPTLTTPDQRAFFARMQAACPAIPLQGTGDQRELAPAEKYNPGRSNCENPETYPIWPYREVSLSRPQLLAEAKTAYAHRKSNLPTGWGYDGNCAALLGLTDEAARILQIKCANSHGGYRWPATWGPNFDWLPDQNHGGNLLETTQLMLLQGEAGGKILLLPAWPKNWDVNFKLHAPGQTTVECTLKAGKIVTLNVMPESRRKDVVLPQWAVAGGRP